MQVHFFPYKHGVFGQRHYPANIYLSTIETVEKGVFNMFKLACTNYRICSKLTIKTPERLT